MRKGFSLCLALMIFFFPHGLLLPANSVTVEGVHADVSNLTLLEKERQIRDEIERKIQHDILDPILGKGKAMVFVTLQLDIVTQRQKLLQAGSGTSAQSMAQNKLFADTEYVLPGIPKAKRLEDGELPLQEKTQQALQEQGQERLRVTQKTVIRNLEIVILHDERISQDLLTMVRQRIADALKQFALKPEQISMQPIRMQGKLLDDLRQPIVYIPALFALLLFLFLLFLFGPFASALRGFVRTLERRQGTEVNVESEFKGADQAAGGPGAAAGVGGAFGTAIEGELNASERKKTPEELEQEQVFSYITEENIGRLIYLLKWEEPWVTAIVLTYLKPDHARKVITAMPAERQAQIAIETATIRQLNREQVLAIDQDIRRRVNFIIGGIGPLLRMLSDADPQTMEGILEYLKNEKPEIFEMVRKRLVIFDDLVSMPDRVIATLFRELKPVEIARALKGASPDLERKVFANMSSGAANLVREEIELLGDVSAEDILKERQKIINTVKRLESEGKISFREKPPEGVLEGVEEDAVQAQRRKQAWETKMRKEQKAAEVLGDADNSAWGQSSEGTEKSVAAQSPYEEGAQLYQEGRYAEAAAAFAKAAEERPNFWEAYQYMGGCYYALGQFQEALECYERVLAMNPTEEMRSFVESIKLEAAVHG